MMLNLPWLLDLVALHGTPGDETDVNNFLTQELENLGCEVTKHGNYAISATVAPINPELPTILVCGHTDSPGFIVDGLHGDKLSIVKIGGASFDGASTPSVVKTSSSHWPSTIHKIENEDGETIYKCDRVSGVKLGDRVCYKSSPVIDENGLLKAPFLDNRVGCYMLLELAKYFHGKELPFNLVLGANGTEEMCGFGAKILGQAIQPDFVICLDATYCNKSQDIAKGKGPVITLSDASALLSIEQRENLLELFYDFGIKVQTEVYNYSGTDAKAFPNLGLPCPVIPLLLPTDGNHSPIEVCDIEDLETMLEAVIFLAQNADDYDLI